jgi:flagellar protein FliO/FliZ
LKHAAAKEKPAAREEKVESAAAAGAAAAAGLTAALREATSPGMAGKDFEKELFLDYSEPTVPPLPSFGESIFKVGGALGIVLAMVLFLAFTAKRYLAGAETAMGTKKQVKVLSSHFIGVKKSVTLVEIAGEILVLGVTNDNINLLARYDDPEKIERIKFTQRLPDRPMGIFKRLPILSRMTGSRGRKKTAFAQEMDSRTRAMKERDEKTAVERKTAKEELVKKAAGTIASRMRAFEHAPA